MARLPLLPICILLALAAVLSAGCSSAPPDGTPFVPTTGVPPVDADPSAVLAMFVGDVNTTLEEMDRNAAFSAAELGATGLSGDGANASLTRLAASSPYAIDAVTITPDGRIAAAMPAEYGAAVGTHVGNQSHVQRGLADRLPLMSEVFRAVEGSEASVIQYPVTGGDGAFLGLVSIVFEPGLLLADRADRALSGTAPRAWAMAPDGCVICDPDPARVRRGGTTDRGRAGRKRGVLVHPARRSDCEAGGALGDGRASRDGMAGGRRPGHLIVPHFRRRCSAPNGSKLHQQRLSPSQAGRATSVVSPPRRATKWLIEIFIISGANLP